MGAPMARNLADADHEVRVWNRSAEKAEGLGAQTVGSPAEAADGAEVVITMLADGPAVASVMEGVTLAARPGLVAGEHRRDRVVRAAAPSARARRRIVDGPVLGTRQPAEKGELIVLASGAGRERLQPVFDAVAVKVVDLGDEPGAGSRMKLVLNAWIVSLVEGLAESIAFAEGIGVDPQRFLEVIEGGPLGPAYAQVKGKAMVERSFEPSFSLALAAKDAGLVADAAAAAGLELPLPGIIREQMEKAIEAGHGAEDMAATFLASCLAPAA